MNPSLRFLIAFWALAGLALTVVCYWPGLHGGFAFDDYPNIVKNPALRIDPPGLAAWWSAAVTGYPGFIGRPLSMLSFAINLQLGGPDPFYFKLVNLGIHLLTGLSLGLLGYLLLSATRPTPSNRRQHLTIAALAALAWLVHPFNLTSVVYVVQRMTGLTTMFLVWGTLCYTYGRLNQHRNLPGWRWILIGLFGFGGLAALSKETGLLLPLYLLIVEGIFFRFRGPKYTDRKRLFVLFGLTLGLPLVALTVLLILSPDILLGAYSFREFSLTERLLTESRVLVWYLRMLAVPATSDMGIYLDHIPISHSLFDPPSTFLSILLLLVLGIAGVVLRKKAPILAFACLWFLAGHTMESTILPLEIAFEHRNYLPGYGVLLAISHTLLWPSWSPRTLRIRKVAAILWIGILAFGLALRAHEWGDELRHAMIELEKHPLSWRNNIEVGSLYSVVARAGAQNETFTDLAIMHFEKASEIKPNSLSALVGNLLVRLESRREIPPSLLPHLRQTLAETPFDPNGFNAVIGLIECQIKNARCLLPEQTFMSLIEAALRNPTLSNRYRADVYVNSAEYYGLLRKDHRRALEYARLAVENQPADNYYRIYYATWLMAIDDFDLAGEQLAIARKVDAMFTMHHRLTAMEIKLRKLRDGHNRRGQPERHPP